MFYGEKKKVQRKYIKLEERKLELREKKKSDRERVKYIFLKKETSKRGTERKEKKKKM